MDHPSLRIGVSACLRGQEVRYDGGHKREAILDTMFGLDVEWIPVCPEVEVGMSTPREPLRLERGGGGLRMVTVSTRIDYTDAMRAWARGRIATLRTADLDGYVLKSDSPSCGKAGLKVFGQAGPPVRDGTGLFAGALMAAMPLLPVEEESRLRDPEVREEFLRRVIAFNRSRAVRAEP